jgi:hypothetical protein
MLFMSIITYEPEKRNEMIKRRAERAAIVPPKGAKSIGEWSVIGGGKVFRLVEVEDPKVAFGVAAAWSDLCKIEIIPVMETEEALKLIPKSK